MKNFLGFAIKTVIIALMVGSMIAIGVGISGGIYYLLLTYLICKNPTITYLECVLLAAVILAGRTVLTRAGRQAIAEVNNSIEQIYDL